jgi:hypothetical protein
MKDKIKYLRLKLQSYSIDLKNLTENDLIEAKWEVRKRIYVHLYSTSPMLIEQSKEFDEILNIQNQFSLLKRQNKLSKDEISDNDQNIKTKFVNTIIVILYTYVNYEHIII